MFMPEAAGPVGDGAQDHAEGGQAQQLQRLGVGQPEEHAADHARPGRARPTGPSARTAGPGPAAARPGRTAPRRTARRPPWPPRSAVPDAVGATGQALGRSREALVEVVDVGLDGDVDEGHQVLAGHADRDAQQVDPPEPEPEVGARAASCRAAGWPGGRRRGSRPTGRRGWTGRTTSAARPASTGRSAGGTGRRARRRCRRRPPASTWPPRNPSAAYSIHIHGGRPGRRAGPPVELPAEGDVGCAEPAGAGPTDGRRGSTGIRCRLGWCARSRGIHRLFGPVAHSPTIPTVPPGGVPGPTVGGDASGVPVARSMKR